MARRRHAAKNLTPVRRSGRPRKASGRARTAANTDQTPIAQPQSLYDRPLTLQVFLERVYFEIKHAAHHGVTAVTRDRVCDHLRRARTRRLFESLSHPDRLIFRNRIPQVGTRELKTFHDDNAPILSVAMSRLATASRRLGYPVLSICLHSETVCNLLTSSISSATWTARLDELNHRKASLELFAKTNGLSFMQSIRSTDTYFKRLSTRLHTAQITTANKDPTEFGIEPRDMVEIHPANVGAVPNHLWALHGSTAATRCQARFVIGRKLKKARATLGRVGEQAQCDQEEITDSVILPDYSWTWKSKWPENDPRYAGFEGDECLNCLSLNSAPLTTERKKEISKCRRNCTIEKHHARHDRPLPIMLELFDTGRCGVGVRSLQEIAKGEVIGVYLGEIYPMHKKDEDQEEPCRYEGSDGSAYRLGQRLERRPEKRKASDAGGGTPKKRRVNREEEPAQDYDLADLDDNEYHMMVIDSMVKGNWTRFINHNCGYNTTFQHYNYGMRRHTVIEATRDIAFGEEITIDYGPEYFPRMNFACKCGSFNCRKWNDSNKRTEKRTLEAVCRASSGPAWTRTVPALNQIWGV